MVFVDTIFHDALGEYVNSEKEVLFYFDNGMVHNAYYIMTGVLNFWITYLYKMNIIDESFYFDTQQTLYVPRHLAREHSFDMGTIIPNVPIEFEIINQRYNYILNQVLPIGQDESRITGMKIIYK